jgi:serine/threonine protein kinase
VFVERAKSQLHITSKAMTDFKSPVIDLPVLNVDVHHIKLTGKCVGEGNFSTIFLLTEGQVIKIPNDSSIALDHSKLERQAYLRFAENPSPHVLQCFGFNDPRGIILEGLEISVRRFLIRNEPAPTEHEILDWPLQAARGFAFIHSCGVVQADPGCHNMLVDSKHSLKLCDFGGCSIKGQASLVCCERWVEHPEIK